MNRNNEYRAKGFELLSLAETVNDPERRARHAAIRPNVDEFIGTGARSTICLRVTPWSLSWDLGENRLVTAPSQQSSATGAPLGERNLR